jgi:hypothetical protein
MAVDLFSPRIKVTLFKLIDRTGGVASDYVAANKVIDLTPYLGDGGAVRTSKGRNDDAGGFSIMIQDQVVHGFQDSLYALAEPMDMVEIRASRAPTAGAPALLMRGFVTGVRRVESMGADGPERMVVIQGQDFGKLWSNLRVIFALATTLDDVPYLDQFRLQAALGISAEVLPVGDFMAQLIGVVNKMIEQINAFSAPSIVSLFAPAIAGNMPGQVIPQSVATFQGTLWSVAAMMADRPWNELFILDDESAPRVVFRPVPFRDLAGGQLIMDGAADPGTIEISAKHVVAIDVGRSDASVANFFYVQPGRATLDSSGWVGVGRLQDGNQQDFKYGNNSPTLFGVREMSIASQLVPTDVSAAPDPTSTADNDPYLTWNVLRAEQLKKLNRDNGAFEQGTLTVQGSELFQIGKYLRLTRGQMISTGYIDRVDHTIVPLQTWTTTLSLIRGDGFTRRNAAPISPYWTEGRTGPYDAAAGPATIRLVMNGGA